MVASGENGVRCVRCGETLAFESVAAAGAVPGSWESDGWGGSMSDFAVGPARDANDWEMAEQLRHVEHVLLRLAPDRSRAAENDTTITRRFDAAHQGIGDWHTKRVVPADGSSMRDRAPSKRAKRPSSLLAWSGLTVGLAVFSCGLSLLAWSQLTGRVDLWSVGVPITLAGQLGLVLGLIFGFEQTWQSHRELSERLEEARREPSDPRQEESPEETDRPSAHRRRGVAEVPPAQLASDTLWRGILPTI